MQHKKCGQTYSQTYQLSKYQTIKLSNTTKAARHPKGLHRFNEVATLTLNKWNKLFMEFRNEQVRKRKTYTKTANVQHHATIIRWIPMSYHVFGSLFFCKQIPTSWQAQLIMTPALVKLKNHPRHLNSNIAGNQSLARTIMWTTCPLISGNVMTRKRASSHCRAQNTAFFR